MSTYILTSMFPDGFNNEVSIALQREITSRSNFAFVASEFEKNYEKTDHYYNLFLDMFKEQDIHFEKSYVVDGRMSPAEVQKAIAKADVIWLSGGDTPTQFSYFRKYGLDKLIQQHTGVIIGMSAGAINLSDTAICTVTSGHYKQEIYHGLGCVNIIVEPHFDRSPLSQEVLNLSDNYTIYGLCDNSMIICKKQEIQFVGEVYRIFQQKIEQIN